MSVHFDGSVSPRERGKPFSGTMYRARPGDVVYSRIDIHNGAVGVVPDGLEGVVTNEYPVLIGHDDSAARFAQMLLRASPTQAYLKAAKSGTTGRKRVALSDVLSLTVPIPSKSERDDLLARYAQAMAGADALELEATKRRSDAWAGLEAALVRPTTGAGASSLHRVARFRDLDRWDGELVAHDDGMLWPVVTLGDVADVRLGAQIPRRGTGLGEAHPYLRAANVQKGYVDLNDVKIMCVRPSVFAALEVERGDVLFVEGNSLEEVGRASVWGHGGGYMLQNSVIRARARHLVDSDFLSAWFNTPAGRAYVRSRATTTTGTLYHIGAGKLAAAPLPLPPLDVQRRLAAELSARLGEVDQLISDASAMRARAKAEFEAAVFGSGVAE